MSYKKVESEFINIDDIDLDYDNPRIARILEMYTNREDISSEQISLALGTDGSDSSHTTFNSLKESIRTNGGVIHPIIVNRVGKRYVVIEGNTRVQIYKDFAKLGVSGQWKEIMAVIYTDLSEETVHAIRLQSHLVGPRDWDPYSKAKYLHMLYNQEKLPFSQIIDFCGGDRNKTQKYIHAYELMENHYRPQLESENDFDAEKFSAFIEYQNGKVTQAISDHGFSIDDFANWIIDEKIPQLSKIRQLPMVLANPVAKAAFIKGTIDDGIRILDVTSPTGTTLKDASLDQLATEISKRIRNMSYEIMKIYKTSSSYAEKKAIIFEALDELKEFCDDISSE
ncbi:MAG TPA: ParB N-terminal domain-containing protein [Anaerolineaceae bacterium]|nr:ParB N-terminal domain-containing protein [Anaerolineaceae bacterium]